MASIPNTVNSPVKPDPSHEGMVWAGRWHKAVRTAYALQVMVQNDELLENAQRVRPLWVESDDQGFEVNSDFRYFTVDKFPVKFKENVYLFTSQFLEDADRFGLAFPFQSVKIEMGGQLKPDNQSKQLFYCVATSEAMLDFLRTGDTFVTHFVGSGFKESEENGALKAQQVWGSSLRSANLLSNNTFSDLQTASRPSEPRTELQRFRMEKRGWNHS